MFKQNLKISAAGVLVVLSLGFARVLTAQDSAGFLRAYDALTDSCNVCHRNHGYGFILIARPSVPTLTNQRYEP